ncbi:MAG: single-stranded DNA-binding protein [Paucibacter sp.]|nr:single-stranded DNA-binding protein [Roseateles sp.]
MASVNKVIIIGNLGRDPELRYNPSGTAFCTISLATTRSWKNRESGEKQEETEWHRVVFNDKLAEIVGQYCKKGRPLYVEGRLRTRKWTDKEGKEVYTTEIIANEMQLLGGRDGGDEGGGGGYGGGQARGAAGGGGGYGGGDEYGEPAARAPAARAPAPRAPAPAPRAAAPAPRSATGFDDMDDDIPF